jgi:hypothetical protein
MTHTAQHGRAAARLVIAALAMPLRSRAEPARVRKSDAHFRATRKPGARQLSSSPHFSAGPAQALEQRRTTWGPGSRGTSS